jgi:hypothetical protein
LDINFPVGLLFFNSQSYADKTWQQARALAVQGQ